jgi:uncharacterized protein (TIGR02453 family)
MSSAKPAVTPVPFTGFPASALAFFKGIAKNNTKDWYDAHAEEYKRNVIAPAQSFVTELGARLAKLSPGVAYDVDPNGRGSIKKIQTDRRFNPDREPYKTSLQLIFWQGPLKVRKENSVFYLKLDPEGLVFAAGLKYFERSTLAAYRASLQNPSRAAELHKAVQAVTKSGYMLGGAGGFKKLPAGVDPDSSIAPYFLHDSMHAWRELPLGPEVHSAALLDLAYSQFKSLLPIHKWCVGLLESL